MALKEPKETDEDLNRLERDIRQLKVEYDQYFGGGRKRPPTEIEWRIEQVVKRYGDRGAEMGYGQRFRLSNLLQTYSKYREIFHKKMMKREQGTVERHFGAAARIIEAERAGARKGQGPVPVVVTCSDPAQEPRKVEQLYSAFREALESSGESTEQLSEQKFTEFLLQKSQQLHKLERSGDVEFVVLVEDGKARLKARVKT
jgi:hypothetical protein